MIGFAGGGGTSSDYGNDSSGWSSGSSSGWSDYSSSSYRNSSNFENPATALFSLALVLGVMAVIIFVLMKPSRDKKVNSDGAIQRAKMSKAIAEVDHNTTEIEKWAHKEAERIFVTYQNDWSNLNLHSIKTYTTDSYYQHASLMLEALKQMRRQNKISEIKVAEVSLLSTLDGSSEIPATIMVQFKFSGLDELFQDDTRLHADRVYGAYEIWRFVFDGKHLKLDGITPATVSSKHLVSSMEEFAKARGMFYSPDWGRCALPTKGTIFKRIDFHYSDVNNHVIGKWGDALVQLYTYAESPNEARAYYLVGQITVPKKYDWILIKSKLLDDTVCVMPAGCKEIKMEWEEFNSRYQVFASKKDTLPAFELLNPSFMANLYDKGLNYNLEVVDNMIYIFAKIEGTKVEDYEELFGVLELGYKELKM